MHTKTKRRCSLFTGIIMSVLVILAEFTRDFKPLHKGTTRKVLNDEIPDNDILYLYQ